MSLATRFLHSRYAKYAVGMPVIGPHLLLALLKQGGRRRSARSRP